jgi:hypothetical protein
LSLKFTRDAIFQLTLLQTVTDNPPQPRSRFEAVFWPTGGGEKRVSTLIQIENGKTHHELAMLRKTGSDQCSIPNSQFSSDGN